MCGLTFRNVFLLLICLLCAHRILTFSVPFEWTMFTLLLVMYCLPIYLQFLT